MLLACDIGNTNLTIGLFSGDELVFRSKIATSSEKSEDEYAIVLHGLFDMNQVKADKVTGAIISSVVRPLNDTVMAAIERLIGSRPLLVGPGVKTGLNIKTDIPSQIGADIVANSVAAMHMADYPLVVLALGTATTLTGINSQGELCGVLICPGVGSSLNALSARAAELPRVALERPRGILGKNTIDSMVNGVVHGSAAMIEGLLDRIAREWHLDNITVVTTGGYAARIIPYIVSGHRIIHEPDLTLLGLKKIYQLSRRRKTTT